MTNSYTIKPGDTLSAIAQRHGLRDWRLLYFTSANANFREQYPDPDTIRPGAQIRIPPNPEAQMRQLRTKLDELRRVRLQIIQFGEKGKSELTASTRQIKTFGSSVDAAATVATLVYSLGSLVGKGLQWNAAT